MTKPATCHLRVRVQPNATRTEIVGWRGGALGVRTTAPPVSGKANRVAVEVLAHALGIPRTSVSVIRGHGSRDKVMEIVGIDEPELHRRLKIPVAPDTPAATAR